MTLSVISRSRSQLGALIVGLLTFSVPHPTQAQIPFTTGNLVVYRVGDGVTPLASSGSPVYLDEYTTSGTLIANNRAVRTTQSSPHWQLIASGTATSEGFLNLSTDARFVTFLGYGTDLGSIGNTVPRVVGVVGSDGVIDTTTGLTGFATASNPRSVVSTDGTDLWVSGGGTSSSGGVRYVTKGNSPALTPKSSTLLSTTVTDTRVVNIFNGQLYVSSQSGTSVRLGSVGTGLPKTSGNSIANLPNFAANSGSPFAFYFADLDSSVAGVDTLYVADDNNPTGAGGITKYSRVGTSWFSKGSLTGTAAEAYRGLTGVVVNGKVTLYAIRQNNQLISVADSKGYNQPFAFTVTVLANAPTNTVFRGVAFAPMTAPTINSTTSDSSIVATSSSVVLTLKGNFVPGFSTVQWNGQTLAINTITATQITATVPAGYAERPGYAKVIVSNSSALPSSVHIVNITPITSVVIAPVLALSIVNTTRLDATTVQVDFVIFNIGGSQATGTLSAVTLDTTPYSSFSPPGDLVINVNGYVKGTMVFPYSSTGFTLLRATGIFTYGTPQKSLKFSTTQRVNVP